METTTSDLVIEEEEREITPHWDPELADEVNELILSYQLNPDNLGIVIENYQTGQMYKLNENTQFIAASLYKLPLAMIYYEAIESGLDSLSTYEFLPEYYEDAGYLSGDYEIYSWVPLQDLLSYAIVFSDNNAGHILFENLGGWENYVIQRQKYYRTQLDDLQESQDQEAEDEEVTLYEAQIVAEPAEESEDSGQEEIYELEITEVADPENELVVQNRLEELEYARNLENTVSALYMSDCLYYIYQNEKMFKSLIDDLLKAQPEAYLNTSLNGYYAQKYGALGSVLNIAGLHNGTADYSIVVLTQNEEASELFMKDLGVLVQKYFEPKSPDSEN